MESTTDILLAEDNEDEAILTIRALKNKLKKSVKWVRNGEECMEYIIGSDQSRERENSSLPKLIILDLKMPKMDGLEILKKMNENPQLKTIPTIIFTSSSNENDMINCYEHGVNSYIVKPINFSDFNHVISEIISYWFSINNYPLNK